MNTLCLRKMLTIVRETSRHRVIQTSHREKITYYSIKKNDFNQKHELKQLCFMTWLNSFIITKLCFKCMDLRSDIECILAYSLIESFLCSKTLLQQIWFQLPTCERSISIKQHSSSSCIWIIYLHVITVFKSLHSPSFAAA